MPCRIFFIAVGLQDLLETKIWYNDFEKSFSKDLFTINTQGGRETT